MIPKIIHQIWFQGFENLPEKYLENRKTWLSKNKNYKFINWNETSMKEFINKYYPIYIKNYDKLPYMHQKIDVFKYMILYKIGGVYVDMDTFCLKPIDELLKKYPKAHVIIGYNDANLFESLLAIQNIEMVNNGIILSQKNHPFFKELIEHSLEGTDKCKNTYTKINCISETTGPKTFTSYALKYKSSPNFEIIDSKYIEPCFSKNKWCKADKESFVYHDHAQTWTEELNILDLPIYFYYTIKHFWYICLILIIIFVLIYKLIY